MTDERHELAYYQARPERYKVASNGAIYDREAGRFCDMITELNPHTITKENAAVMVERRRQIAQLSQLRGLARAAGVDLEEATLEEIARGAGDAVENMTLHFYKVFMGSSNVRGLAEAFRGLTAPMLGEPSEQPRAVLNYHQIELGKQAAQLLVALREAIPPALDGEEV